MPRKMTKTMKAARIKASEQKRARNAFKDECAEKDYQFGSGNIHDNRLRNFKSQGTVTGRLQSKVPNKSNEPKSFTLDNEKPKVDITLDLSKLEERVVYQMSVAEYAEREAVAQTEINRKKTCIAPAYNKGSYQYIGTREQAKYIGK